MKPGRFAVASLVLVAFAAVGCGGRSGLRLIDGGAGTGGRVGDGGPGGQGGGAGGSAGRDGGATGGFGGGVGGNGGVGGSGGFGGSGGTGGSAVQTGLGVTPALATAGVGTSRAFQAIATFSNGTTRDVTGSAVWSSSNQNAATVMGGVASARMAGTTTITATSGGFSGRAMLTVTGAMLTGLTLSPPDLTVPLGMKASFTATGIFSDGSKQDLTGQATWMSSDPGIASVSGGVVAGLRPGTVAVLASFQNVLAKASVTVTTAKLASLQISPSGPTLPVSGAQQFTAIAIFSDGTRSDVTTQAGWSSSNERVIGFRMPVGFAVAQTPGVAVVTASFSGLSASTMVTVARAPLVSIRVNPASATTPVGTSQAFTATGVFADGTSSDVTSSVAWSSTDEKIATVSNAPGSQGVATGLSAGGVGITATFGGVTGTAKLAVTETKVISLSITPKNVTLGVMAVQQLTATATFSDGTSKDVTDSATWMSGDPSIADVSNSPGSAGQVIGLRIGGTAVVASYGGLADKIPVTVTSAVLTSLDISPPALNLVVGQGSRLTAFGRYSDGNVLDVTDQVTWTSDDPMVATVTNIVSPGFVTGVGAGTTAVRAQLAGQEAKVGVTVTGGGTMGQQLSVSPVLASARVGQAVQFGATLIRADGTSMNVTGMATWSSSNPMVATLGGMGPGGRSRATCLAEGTTTISATYMGLSDSTVLTCTPARTLIGLQVTPFLATLIVGQTIPFQATALFDDNSTQNVTGQTTWVSSDQMVADVSNQGGPFGGRGQTTAIGAGTATITGTYMGLSASGTVTVSAGTLTGISVSPPTLSLRVGQSQGLQVTALFSDGTSRNVTGMSTFLSSDQMVADVSNGGGPGGGMRGQVTGLGQGDATITVTFMGFTATVPVSVAQVKVMEIQVTPTNPTVPIGVVQPFQATAVYSDFSTQNVTGQATWNSSDPMVAPVSNAGGSRGQATALAGGSTTISATFMGITGSSTLTVTNATIKEIQVSPASVSTPVGVSVRFFATAILSDGTSRDVTGTATWTSSDPSVVGISNVGGSRGLATAIKPGSVGIVATAAGVSGKASYTVGAQTLTSIAVAPAMTSLKVGSAASFTATGTYSDGSMFELTDDVTWISNMTGVATVSNVAANRGLVTAVGAGTTTIEAHFQGVTGTSAVTVTP
ncbi:MAG TPA: Ig-like domain-containing protein [Polyangia bacterium]|nr:Ig-like domain-containing protein [Polyangia bacterium]